MPEISVIIPVYNSEKYLPRCLDSIISQTYRDFEVILIDDGSTDRSGSLCDAYAENDSRFTVIHRENLGQAAARNRAIDVAMQGESKYLTFVDSDDCILPNCLETLRGIIGDGKISSVLFSTDSPKPSEYANAVKVAEVGAEEYYCRGNRLPFVLWGKLFDKALFESLRLPQVAIHEDTLLVYRILFKAERITVAFAPLYCYFQNPEGVSAAAWSENRLTELDAMDEQRAFFERHGYEKALRHCAITEARMISYQLAQTEGTHPEVNGRLREKLGLLTRSFRLKRSDICLK